MALTSCYLACSQDSDKPTILVPLRSLKTKHINRLTTRQAILSLQIDALFEG